MSIAMSETVAAVRHPNSRLGSIEAVRGVAATAVVLYHVARHVDLAYGVPALKAAFQFGHAGVDLFFVISGFIIFFVHKADIGAPGRLGHYLSRRFSRVMPLYWVALCVTLLMGAAGRHALPAWPGIIWSFTLLPSIDPPTLGVAWTLQFELVFYAVFALLILDRRLGIAVLAAWIVWVLAAWAGIGGGGGTIPDSLYDTYNFEFVLGMGVAFCLHRVQLPRPHWLFVIGVAAFCAAAAAENLGVIDGYAASSRLAYGIPSALLVAGLAEIDRSGGLRVPGWLRLLGGASYSIYLFQFVFIGTAWQLWLAAGLGRWRQGWASFPLLVAASLLGGILVARLVEQPLLRAIRGGRRRARLAQP